MEEHAYVDEHANADKKVGDEEGIADKLDAVHQRRYVRYVAVENQSGEERAEDAFYADRLAERGAHEEDGKHEYELHDGIAIASQEPACKARDDERQRHAVKHKLAREP